MGQFSISDLEHLSGVKAHTIRMWEQRYGILCPVRTATNIRTYCDDDLRRLLNVALLCGRGHRISKVASLSEQELAQAVVACHDEPHDYARQVSALLAAMLDMDEPQLSDLLDKAIGKLGLEAAMLNIAYPFLQRVGLLWQAGSITPVHEHIVSNLLRQKMLAATESLRAVAPATARRWVLFLPEAELHELALLFMYYALRARGQHVLYLGQNMPLVGMQEICQQYQPYALCTVMTAQPDRSELQSWVNNLAQLCPGPKLYLYGPLAQQEDLVLPSGARRIRLMTDFLTLAEEKVGAE
ncbi:MerR family transcriptional regulator [Hymenobacter sp. BT175]|uniref:MerR family transcriptional regulator n=1 Tax=Hymenobacter translucens TaxID=2886507 RepID=UPI001D0E72DF|nr:MerR family transcriptional regulator [Hymenobacter translucens]MCC2548683.1 MerR family transcriptional regulator [Hymenobacter translucens]